MVLAELTSQFLGWSQSLVETWGYLGIFLVNLIGSASIVLPIFPTVLVVVAFAPLLNPWLVGLSAGLGAAIGELTGYLIGRGGREIIEEKYEKWLRKSKKWIEEHGTFPIILLFAATPLPTDVVGIISGIIKYDIRKFFIAVLIGKILLNTMLALLAFYGFELVLGYFSSL